MLTAKKITLQVPEELLNKAQKATGKGITATIKEGLALVAARQSFENLKKWRGKVKFSKSMKELKQDRV